MNKSVAIELRITAHEIAEWFTSKRRDRVNGERFWVSEIIPISDDAACVIMEKSSGKKAAFFFYYLRNNAAGKRWRYFVPTDSHLVGMANFTAIKVMVEAENYNKNFKKNTEIMQ